MTRAAETSTLSVERTLYAGRYQIAGELGAGGMGRVLRARDTKLNRNVAVKVLARGAHDQQHRRRFEQEARAAGALNHRNIVAIYDIAEHEGEPFIVTELLEGHSLRAVLAGGPLPTAEARDLALQLAQGMAAAHAKGIVHRDVKPENLFLTDEGELKILDFGIAKLVREDGGVRTDTGAVLGTPRYMSPEQVRGEPTDARTDVFAFGCVVQEMLTGTAPFEREATVETGYAILHDPPRPLPANVPVDLRQIIEHCLPKDREARFGDATEILKALGGSPVRFGSPLRVRRRFGWPVATAGAIVAVVVAGSRMFPLRGVSRIESLAVLPLENRSGDAQQEYLADGMTAALIEELGAIRSLRVISRSSAMAYKGAKKPLPQIAKDLGVDAVVEGSVARLGGRVRLAAQLIRVAGEKTLWSKTYEVPTLEVPGLQADMASALARGLNAVLTPDESGRLAQKRPIDPTAYDLLLRALFEGNEHQGCESYARTRALLERAIAADPDFAEAHAQLSNAWAFASWMTCIEPRVAAPKARAEAERALQLDGSNATAHVAIGGLAMTFDGDFARAEPEFRKALELSPGSADVLQALTALLIATGRHDEGIAMARRHVLLAPATPSAYSMTLGWALYYVGRYEEAIAAQQRALELDPKLLYGHMEIGWNLFELGRVRESLAETEKARAVLDPGKSCFDDTVIAAALAWGGKRDEALALLKPWEEKAATQYVDAYQLALPRVHLGDKDKAFEWLEMAWRQRSPSFMSFRVAPIDLEKRAWLGPLKGDPRVAELIRRPPAP